MATTEIHAIRSTPQLAIAYALADKVIELNSNNDINKDVVYRVFEQFGKDYVCYPTLNSVQNCNLSNPYQTFKETQEKWQGVRYSQRTTEKNQEPVMWHLHQSFDGMEVSPEIANEIGRKLAEEVFKDFAVTISTHTNTNNIHNHLIICAWNNEGKKWNSCHATYQEIRRVSDRLCKEYGLRVLEETEKVQLKRWTDKDGNTRYYEPTKRKRELEKSRAAGDISSDDVNSYRNTSVYSEEQEKKRANKEEVKNDIDALLPTCRSYDELLERLREIGYTVRDKKKNGDWLSHISFKSPTQDKATRDDSIGDGVFYVRENLERYIEEQARKLEKENYDFNNVSKSDIPYFTCYEYGETDIDTIDDEYKTIKKDGQYQVVNRTEFEKKAIADIRIKDEQIKGLIDTTTINKIVAEQRECRKAKRPYITKTEEQKLVAQIQQSFRCLQYTEKNNIFSYKQIIDLYSVSKNKYNATVENFTNAEKAISQLKDVLLVPSKLDALLKKMDTHREDMSYILEEYNEDKRKVDDYKAIISKFKIGTEQGFNSFERKISDFESRQEINRGVMAKIVYQMSELENCIRTYDRIDTERGSRNEQAILEFERIKSNNSQQNEQEREQQQGRKNKNKGRDER